MKIRFFAALLLAALLLLSGCAAKAASPAPTQPLLSVAEEPAVPLAPVPPTQAPTLPAEASAAPTQITREDAIAIALADAGFTESQVSRLKTEFDYDDGQPEYEVEFRKDGWEYSYDIHAETGKILSKDKDRDD